MPVLSSPLICTIIMLILAGVAIATLGGQDGIIRRAREAAEKTNAAQENELAVLNELENFIENQGKNGNRLEETIPENSFKINNTVLDMERKLI